MQYRTSIVDKINTIGISNSAIFNIGDSNKATPKSRAIAVQKEGPTFQGDILFDDYPIFHREANWPDPSSTVVQKRTTHHNPTIQVQQVSLMALSSSSLFQVGNLKHISADARIKHFRMLLDDDEDEQI